MSNTSNSFEGRSGSPCDLDGLQGKLPMDPCEATQLASGTIDAGNGEQAEESASDKHSIEVATGAPRCPHKDPDCPCDGWPIGLKEGTFFQFSRISGDRSEYSESVYGPFLSAEEIERLQSHAERRAGSPNSSRSPPAPIHARRGMKTSIDLRARLGSLPPRQQTQRNPPAASPQEILRAARATLLSTLREKSEALSALRTTPR